MASKYLQLFPIPATLPHVVRDLTREILRYQPQDIIQFCAFYFKARKNVIFIKNVEFIWNEDNPRAPRPADYKKQSKHNPLENLKPKKTEVAKEKPHENLAKVLNQEAIKHEKNEVKEQAKIDKHEEKVEEKPGKVVKSQEKPEERKDEISAKGRDLHSGSASRTGEISGISSLPDNTDEAASIYVDTLLDKVQKHIEAST